MQFAEVLLVSLVLCPGCASSGEFADYYPHTRWVDRETRSIVVDAFRDRLVISRRGKAPVTVPRRWRGRGFWRASQPHSELGYFAVAHEGGRRVLYRSSVGEVQLQASSTRPALTNGSSQPALCCNLSTHATPNSQSAGWLSRSR